MTTYLIIHLVCAVLGQWLWAESGRSISVLSLVTGLIIAPLFLIVGVFAIGDEIIIYRKKK